MTAEQIDKAFDRLMEIRHQVEEHQAQIFRLELERDRLTSQLAASKWKGPTMAEGTA